MIWECKICAKQWRHAVDRCLFCGGDVYTIRSKKFTVIGATEVFVPSVEHEAVPYYSLLLEDEQGHKLIKKTFDEYDIGDTLVLGSSDAPDVIIGVIGAGTLGVGIAHVAAETGYSVILKSRNAESLEKARNKINKWLLKTRSEKEAFEILDNIDFTVDMALLRSANIIIEAVVEDIEVKKQLFRELGDICPKDTILSSNTSSLSITKLSSVVPNPERVVGMHFFNPVQKMQLVEVIRGDNTSEQTIESIKDLVTKLGKTYVVTTDTPGFIVNRILMPLINEAIQILENGNATAKEIDTAIKLGLNHPMGPLELADLIGLDVCLSIMKQLHEGLNDDRYQPSYSLIEMVDDGLLGKKTGKGFYNY